MFEINKEVIVCFDGVLRFQNLNNKGVADLKHGCQKI